jgi:RNA-binding signal transduction-associated protein 1 with KH domain
MENDGKYLPELLAEKDSLDASFTHAMKLLTAGKVVRFEDIAYGP